MHKWLRELGVPEERPVISLRKIIARKARLVSRSISRSSKKVIEWLSNQNRPIKRAFAISVISTKWLWSIKNRAAVMKLLLWSIKTQEK